MSDISYTTLSTDQRRRSTSNAIDQTKKIQIINDVLQDMQSRSDFYFTQRTHKFEFLGDEPNYNIVNSLSLSDFKHIKDLRVDWEPTQDFEMLVPNDFDLVAGKMGSNKTVPNRWIYTVEHNDGTPILRVNYPKTTNRVIVNSADNITDNGTWAVDSSNSDATNITTDENVGRTSATSINYDIDVSQSGNDYADVSVPDQTSVDLSTHEDVARQRFWVYIPSATYITGYTFFWSSDASATPTTIANYWSKAVTTTADNGSFVNGWNQVEFDWEDATKTGSPDSSDIVYLGVRTSYSSSQTDDTDFRINGITSIVPVDMEMKYYSTYMAKTNASVWQAEITAVTDSTLIPDQYREILINGIMARVFALQGSPHTQESLLYEQRYEKTIKEMIKQAGRAIPKEIRKLKPNITWD